MDDPVPANGLKSDVIHHCEICRSDYEVLYLGRGRVRRHVFVQAVCHADGLPPGVIGVFVARVVSAETHPSTAKRVRIDLGILRTVIPRQMVTRRQGPEIRVITIWDGHPDTEAGIRPLPVVGVAAVLAETQTIDRAGEQRGGVEVGNRHGQRSGWWGT